MPCALVLLDRSKRSSSYAGAQIQDPFSPLGFLVHLLFEPVVRMLRSLDRVILQGGRCGFHPSKKQRLL